MRGFYTLLITDRHHLDGRLGARKSIEICVE